jgi:hypothetical protein
VALQRRRLRRPAGQGRRRTPQVKSLPIARACRKVAAELGAVASFNYRGQDLDAAGIADCNTAAKP